MPSHSQVFYRLCCSTAWRRLISSVLVWPLSLAVAFLLEWVLDWLPVYKSYNHAHHVLVVAFVTSLAVSILFGCLVSVLAERERILSKQLTDIGELNHEVRNHLQVIIYAHSSLPVRNQNEHNQIVLQSAKRISAAVDLVSQHIA